MQGERIKERMSKRRDEKDQKGNRNESEEDCGVIHYYPIFFSFFFFVILKSQSVFSG